MDWVRSFYEKQGDWSGAYGREIESFDRERAALVDSFAPHGGSRILELGCGGGQTAAAIADLGHRVVAIDIVPTAVDHARRIAVERPGRDLSVRLGDFFDIHFDDRFGVVCFFDGFGAGEDANQCRLLERIAAWLAPGGLALVEIYTPWYWRSVAGREMRWEDVGRRYGYDEAGSRMLDTWWRTDRPSETITQSLRCYTPEELGRLAAPAELDVADVVPGGAMDYESGTYRERVPLEEAMQYVAVLRPIE